MRKESGGGREEGVREKERSEDRRETEERKAGEGGGMRS